MGVKRFAVGAGAGSHTVQQQLPVALTSSPRWEAASPVWWDRRESHPRIPAIRLPHSCPPNGRYQQSAGIREDGLFGGTRATGGAR